MAKIETRVIIERDENPLMTTAQWRDLLVVVQQPTHLDADVLERFIRSVFADWFIYRGGNHLALHKTKDGPRVACIQFREVLRG